MDYKVKNKVVLISSYSPSLINFRGDLINDFIKKDYEVICIGPDEDICTITKLKGMGVRYKKIYFKRNGVSIINDIFFIFKLIFLFIKEKPDVVLSYTIKPLIYGSISSFIAGVKTRISLVTGLGFSFSKDTGNLKEILLKKTSQFLYKLGLYSSTHVLFQNPDDRNLLLGLNYVKGYKSSITNGSGVNLIKFSSSSPPSTFPIRFLMTSRLIKEKGVLHFLEAASFLKNKYSSSVEFHLVGWSDEEKNSIPLDYIYNFVNSDVVVFHGKLDDVRPIINKCSIFVLPSYYPEGTPRTILEAMSMGRSIITTDSVGCRETVVNNYNGFLIKPESSQDLIDKMEFFILDTGKVKSMGDCSLSLASEKFDVFKVNKSIFDFCEL